MLKRIILPVVVLGFLLLNLSSFGQGNTTSSITGEVKTKSGAQLIGAAVIAVHTPSGTKYGTIAREDGHFDLSGLRIGGPYTITVSYSGYASDQVSDVYLQLGQSYKFKAILDENTSALSEVIVGAAKSGLNNSQTGAESIIDADQINNLPTVSRSIADFARTNPMTSVDGDNVLSVAGNNNRYNSIFIDGAVNNDVFGLAASGTNGGQTGGSPISLDAIDQIQLVVAPYDVTIGGFAGGGINAVTRSGTNKTEASVYSLTRNQGLAGKTPTDNAAVTPEKLADFSANTFGARVGGAITKDKLFYFVSIETQRQTTPQPFNFADYTGTSSASQIDAFRSKLQNDYNYDAGGYLDNPDELNSNKVFIRFDYNMSQKHKLMVRHSYAYNEQIDANRSSANAINFYNNGIFFPSTTNSSAVELTSQLSSNKTNNLILGYTRVNDDRDPMGENMPYVVIRDGSGTINAGSEQFSTANQLKQNVLTLTDNFKIYSGKHQLTFGTHNEFYNMYNLFVRQNYGVYTFDSLSGFMNNLSASDYDRGYSLVDNKTGDGSKAAASFNAMQLGFYAQDEYAVNTKLKLSGGLRLDVPMFLTQPTDNQLFNETTIATLEAAGKDLAGAKAGQAPKAQMMISPRIGFNYDLNDDNKNIIRGGTGIFTSRVPFVWPGGMYTNNGYTVGGVFNKKIPYNGDWQNQPNATDLGATDAVPSGEMNLFVDNFKYPQVWKTSVGYDKALNNGFKVSFEALFNKTLNNIVASNLNVANSTTNLTGGPDDRALYNRSAALDKSYSYIILVDNTNKGYSYNLSAQVQRAVKEGLSGSLAYTFGESKSINDGTSSQNSSNWRYMENVNGRDRLDVSYSDFDMGHRISGFVGYAKSYAKNHKTGVSFFYNGQSGRRFSYIIANGSRMTNQSSDNNDLIYIPASSSDINLVDYTANGVTVTAAEQWAALDGFIQNDKGLNNNRGGYASRNGSRLPFTSIIDFRVYQDFYITSKGKKHDLQVTFDVFNLTNMINNEWGRRYFMSNDQYALYEFKGFQTGTTTPEYYFKQKADTKPYTIDDSGINSSRWQAQIGVRYSFN
jgi:hypothetical protein